MEITTIIFDLGGVVLTNDWHFDCPEKFQAYSDYFGVSYDDMERGWKAAWPAFKIGKITEEDFWKTFLQTAGAKIIEIEKAKQLWRKYQKPIENMLDLLSKLKENYRLAALATIGREWIDYKRKVFKLNDYFDVIISSGYFGFTKPDPRIYRFIIKELEVKPRQCLYVDDQLSLLSPAKLMGMKTIYFRGQKKLEIQLKESNLCVTSVMPGNKV